MIEGQDQKIMNPVATSCLNPNIPSSLTSLGWRSRWGEQWQTTYTSTYEPDFPNLEFSVVVPHPPITSRSSSLCGTMWGSLETSNAEDSLAAAVGWWLGEKILVAIATKNANCPMRRWLRFKIARNDRLVFQFLDHPWEYQERIHVKTSCIASVLPKFSLIWGLLSIPTHHASTVSSSSTTNIKTMLFGLDYSKIYQTY